MLAQVSFFSKAEASDSDYHIKILEALKRIHIRLVRIETDKIESLKAVQASLLNQIMTIRTSIEQIQATGELNKSEMLAGVQGMKTKILDIESHLRNEVMSEFDRQNRGDKQYRAQLKDSLATDMEGMSKANQQQFKVFSEANNEQLQQIVNALEEQNKKLLQTQALFKTDLIPALDTQSEETRQALLIELSQARAVQKDFLESNHKQTLASLATVEEKNKALIEILKKSILVDEATKSLVETIQQNIGGTNQNIDQTKKMIGILLENKAKTEADLKASLDKGLMGIKSNQTTVTSQLKNLVSLSNQMKKQSSQVEKTINIAANSAKAQADLSNEKLSRLVDILKSFAIEQDKIDQTLKLFSSDPIKGDQILQGQKKLDAAQKKITKALQDLRRKANVNISRTNDILKKMNK